MVLGEKDEVKRWVVAAAVSVALAVGSPVGAAEAVGPPECEMTAVGVSGTLITGYAVVQGPAIHTTLVCHVFLYGREFGVVSGVGAGPVAAVVGHLALPIGPMRVCAELHVQYLNGVRYDNWC